MIPELNPFRFLSFVLRRGLLLLVMWALILVLVLPEAVLIAGEILYFDLRRRRSPC